MKKRTSIKEEELEYWELKQQAAAHERDYWKQKAMKEGVQYDGNSVTVWVTSLFVCRAGLESRGINQN